MRTSEPIRLLVIGEPGDDPAGITAALRDLLPEEVSAISSGGSQGIAKAVAEDPDVILLVAATSGQDALTTCNELKATERVGDIPVIFALSDAPDGDLRSRALDAGADAFLSLPPRPEELATQMRAMAKVKVANRRPVDAWQATFDTVKDAIWILDKDMHVIRSNLAAAQLFDREPGAMLGRHCWDIVHGTNEPIPECPLMRARRSLQRESMDLKIGDRWFEVTVDPILDARGEVAGAVHIVADITERERVLEALKESEDKFRDVFESANVGKSLTLPNGEVRANRAFSQMLGYGLEELAQKNWRELTPPEDIDTIEQILAPLLRGDKDSARFVKRYLRKDGSFIWADVSTVLRRDEDGRPLNFITTAVDITERKQAEAALRESEERYRNILDVAPIAIAVHRGGKILYANPTGLRLMGATSDEEVVDKDIWTVVHPDSHEATRGRMRRFLAGEKGLYPAEEKYVRLDGRVVDVEVMASALNYEGEPAIQVIITDITERKQAESERERLLTAIEQTEDIVIITSPDGRIEYVNPAFVTITGYARAEALGGTPRMLNSGSQDRAFYADLWGQIVSGRTWKGRMVNKRKDGTLYTGESTISPVRDGAGRIIHYVSVQRDITEHLLLAEEKTGLQEQFQQAQKLESVGRLAGGIAHDFNNMMTVILGYGEGILENLREGDPLREEVEQIVEAARRSTGLTRQLLAFSRKQTLQPRVMDLNEVMRNLEDMLRRLIGEHIALELVLAEDVDRVMIDPGQMEQVIMNLAINARDAMPEGGRLLIETAMVDLDRSYADDHPDISPGRYVLLAVTDNGCGMSPAVMNKIFDPFFTTKDMGEGTGLGLSTVYGIVRQSGGNIWVYSEPGQGTTFKIYLPPTGLERQPDKNGLSPEGRKGRGEHILVVEDEDSLRRYIGALIPRLGYRVTLAANGGEALLLMEEKGLEPDVLLSDLIMPNMGGKELVDRLRRSRPGLRVLYMSGYTHDTVDGVSDPGTSFIQKPFTPDDIAAKLREVLDAPGAA